MNIPKTDSEYVSRVTLALTRERDALRTRIMNLEDDVANYMDSEGTLEKERDVARKFKAYVHKRLDDAGVPSDPEPEHNAAHGCRIEGRLNHVFQGRDLLKQGLLANVRRGAQFIRERDAARKERDEAREKASHYEGGEEYARKLADEFQAERDSLRARIQELEGALEQAAKVAGPYHDGCRDLCSACRERRSIAAAIRALTPPKEKP